MALSKDQIANRYGKALFGFAQDRDCLEPLHDEVAVLLKVVQANPDFIRMMNDPILALPEKKQVLQTISAKFSTEMQEFLKLLLSYQRFGELTAILQGFNACYDQAKKLGRGQAISAVKLSDKQLQQVSQAYAAKYGLNSLQLTNQVKPEILGGLILQVGDRRIDGSIKTKLAKIRAHLTTNKE